MGICVTPKQAIRSYDNGPLKKLSVDLIQTYKNINDLYYAKKQSRVGQSRVTKSELWCYDNESNDLIINPEETWIINDKRYNQKLNLSYNR